MQRRVLALALVALFATPGCFVFDELSEGQKLMDQMSSKKEKPAEGVTPEQAAAQSLAEKKQRSKEYWATARTITPGTRDESIASCRIGGSVQFMKRDACLARGGTPK